MRAIIPIDLALPLQDDDPGAKVDAILRARGWLLPETPAQATDVSSSATLDWNHLVSNMAPEHPRKMARDASRLQHLVEAELKQLQEDDPSRAPNFTIQQHEAASTQDTALLTERIELAINGNSGEEDTFIRLDGKKLTKFQLSAAREARLILDQIWEEEQEYAVVAFKYPIFERESETWGTVHYEPGQRRVVIRLRNSNSEKLKSASEHLVKSFLTELHPKERIPRISILFHGLGSLAETVFYKQSKQDRPYTFSRIRVLEANSPLEAYSGEVQPERGFRWTLQQRRNDIRVAVVFLLLGISVLIMESPWAFNVDVRLHNLTRWTDGWLSWFVGNVQRMGSALFVAVFLPVIQIFLFWRATKSQPYIYWSVTERS
jgi:hypothetical protein